MADDEAVVLLQLPWTTLPMDACRHAAVALYRVWVLAVTPSRRQPTALCRRLIPSTFFPPSTHGMALQGGTQSSGGVRVDAAPEVVASVVTAVRRSPFVNQWPQPLMKSADGYSKFHRIATNSLVFVPHGDEHYRDVYVYMASSSSTTKC